MMPSPLRRRRRAALALVAVTTGLAALGACSSDGDDTSATTSTVVIDRSSTTTTVGNATTTTTFAATTTTEDELIVTTTSTVATTTPIVTTTTIGSRSRGDDAAYRSAIRESLDDGTFPDDQLDCIADGIVREVGTERWVAVGVTPASIVDGNPFADLGLEVGTAERLYGVMDGCTDGLRDAMVRSIGSTFGPETMACLDRVVTEDAIRTLFIELFTGNESAGDDLGDRLMGCLP